MQRLSEFLLCCFLLSSFGCASYIPTKRLEYDPIPVPFEGVKSGTLLVTPLKEGRPGRQYPNLLGHCFLTYIPLLPYVKVAYERLDESGMIHERERGLGTANAGEHFTRLFAYTIAKDLSKSGFFEKVLYGSEKKEMMGDVEYVLTGELRSTEFDYYMSSYMLGAAGVLLWPIPIPIGSNEAHIEARLYLRDRKGNLLWKHNLIGKGGRWFTFYTGGGGAVSSKLSLEIARYGKNDKGVDGDSLWAYHALALRSGMEEAKRSLAEFLEQRQASMPLNE